MWHVTSSRLLYLLIFLFPVYANAGTFTVFGPQTFERNSGKPVTVKTALSAPASRSDYILKIESDQVSSAIIAINGEEIAGTSAFNQNTDSLFKVVSLNTENELAVELRSQPGSSITITILGEDNTPPNISYSVDPAANGAGWNNNDVTVTFECSDDFSGISACPDPVIMSYEGENQVIIGTAVDNAGNSSIVDVTINLDKTNPVVAFDVPTLTNQPTLSITGSITDTNSIVSASINGESITLANNTFLVTYQLNEGSNTLTVEAVDIAGNSGQLVKTITLDTIAPPMPNEALISILPQPDGTINLVGAVGSVEGGSIINVHDLQNNQTASVASNQDGSFTLNITAAGGDSLEITATDPAGNISDALVVQLPNNGELQINIDSPQNNDIVDSNRIMVSGTLMGPENVGVNVDGQRAVIVDGRFYANDILLKPGDNQVTASIISIDGQTAESQITVTYNDAVEKPFMVIAKHDTGYAPLTTKFYIVPLQDIEPEKVQVDFNNDGNPDTTVWYSSHRPISRQFGIGVHTVTFQVIDDANNYYELSHQVVAVDLAEIDQQLQEMFSSMRAALINNDVDTALKFIAPYRRQEFANLFSQVGNELPQIATNFGELTLDSFRGSFAQYILLKEVDGSMMGSPVVFILGNDGLWQIEDF